MRATGKKHANAKIVKNCTQHMQKREKLHATREKREKLRATGAKT